MSAYEMAATVEFGLDAKQGLLDLRSETARLKLVARLCRAAIKRLDFIDRAQARARSNGKVHFTRLTRAVARSSELASHRRESTSPLCRAACERRVAALLGDVRVRARLEQRAHRAWSPTADAEWSGRTSKVFSASASGSAPVARIARTARRRRRTRPGAAA